MLRSAQHDTVRELFFGHWCLGIGHLLVIGTWGLVIPSTETLTPTLCTEYVGEG